MPCTGEHLAGADPRMAGTCIKCGHTIPPRSIPRDYGAERRLLDLAGAAAGLTAPQGKRHPAVLALEAAGKGRANLSPDGGPASMIYMPPGRDLLAEAREEIVDCAAHYLLWQAVIAEPGLIAGDHDATVAYDVSMRTLARIISAWSESHIKPS